MATITSTKSGLASDPTVWSGGVVPVEGDKVIIAAGHVVTLDGAYTWGDGSVTATLPNAAVNVYGTLKASRTVNSSLTGKGLILCNFGTQGIDFGTEADPLPSGVTAELVLNKATTPAIREGLRQVTAASGASNFILNTFWSADTRVRGVKLSAQATAGATTITLESSSHNWRVGDELLFMKSSDAALDDTETRTISAISGANITLSSALTYTHLNALPICNLTCDITIRSFNQVLGQTSFIVPGMPGFVTAATLGYYWKFRGVAFQNLCSSSAGGNNSAFGQNPFGAPPTDKAGVVFESCSAKQTVASGNSFLFGGANQITRLTDFVLMTTGQFINAGANFRVTRMYAALAGSMSVGPVSWSSFEGCYFSARYHNSSLTGTNSLNTYTGCYFFGVAQTVLGTGGEQTRTRFFDCDFGYTFGYTARNGGSDRLYRLDQWLFRQPAVEMTNCVYGSWTSVPHGTVETVGGAYSQLSPLAETAFYFKNRDATAHEVYYGSHTLRRENSTKFRGLSSVLIKPVSVGAAAQRVQSMPCANGQTIRVVGYVRMDTSFWNAGDNNLPTVSLSGLEATPVTFTASSAANNAWEKFDLSITNTSGSDGNFVLTYTANAKTVSTGTVYFDGVPDAPFITQCRHYGFLFDETSPTVTVNPYTVATEATAAAYTGVTINATTKRVSFGAGTADTLAKVYDYSQAWGCLNIDKDMPWTRAGALLSLNTGWTVVDPQITGVTWGGGTVEFNNPDTIGQSFDSCDIRFAAGGTYAMGGSVFAGTVEFINTSGSPVTVQIPAGVSYVNTGPNITVELPTSDVDITAAALIAGSRVQLYNVTDATEIYNSALSSTGLTHTLTYSADKVVRLRADHATKLPLEVAGVLTASGLTFLDVQQEDTVYIGNAIDGSAVTEFVADEPNVEVDIDDLDGATSFRRLYAWMQHYFTTEAGIRSTMFGAVTAIDSGTYVINVAKANILLDNVGVLPVAFMNGDRLIRSDGTSVIAPPSGTIHIDSGFVPVVETGVSGLTAAESDKLLSLSTANLDVPVSSRLATASYVAPDNYGITAIKAKTDTLVNAPTAYSNAIAVRTELATELARVDATVSSRLPTAGYTAPDNASIADINNKTDALITIVDDVVNAVESSTVIAKETTATKAAQNAALAVALSA